MDDVSQADQASAEVIESPAVQPFADQLLDELLPEEVDWRHVVVTYPIASLTVAAVGGYLLGRSRGSGIVTALGAFASATVARNINAVVGEDIL